MGAQSSTLQTDGAAASDSGSAVSQEEGLPLDAPAQEQRVEPPNVVESAPRAAPTPSVADRTVVGAQAPPSDLSVLTEPAASAQAQSSVAKRTTGIAATVPAGSTRPPAAPRGPAPIADRVVEIKGTVKHAFPLERLLQGNALGDGREVASEFSIGAGPCSRDADRVVGWEVQEEDSFQTCYVFFYDRWADAVNLFQRHYKVHIRGPGLVAIDHWDIGHDTEDVKRCYVIAEALLLKRTAERSPRLLPKPQGVTIEIAFEEPRSIPDSDQLKYQPMRTIHSRDLFQENAEVKISSVENTPSSVHNQPNPRGKRTLRVTDTSSERSAKSPVGSAYMYTPLSQLNPGYANVYGVVVNLSLPKPSNGRDFYMSLHLVDESTPKREDALQVMVFLPSVEQMPRVLRVGDVVRFHKIRINRYEDKLQGVCNSRATRYLVMRRRTSGSEHIEQLTNSASWTFDKYDEERFSQLAVWSERTLRDDTSLPPGCPQAPRLLGDMQFAESFADVVVRVVHVQEPYGDFTAARLIVWDGSGDASSCQDLYAKLQLEQKRRPGAVPFIPTDGLLMEVIMDSCWVILECMGFLPNLTVQWCRFRNLAVSSEQGEPPTVKHWFELHFREVSSLILIPEFDPDVSARLRNSREGAEPERGKPTIWKNSGTNKMAVVRTIQHQAEDTIQKVDTYLPPFIMERVPVTPLKTVLDSTRIPRKYRCCARVLNVWPTDIEHLAKRRSPGDDVFIYSFVIRMEDSTGEIDVIVHGDDAEKFLHGVPPCDLTKCTSSRSILHKRVTALLTLETPLHFCVKAYTPKIIRSDGTTDDRVRFRLFDTVLKVT